METTIIATYESAVSTQDQALCHLFFHCCLEDELFTATEMDRLSALLVQLELQPKLHIKDELVTYRHYKPSITDEHAYLRFLIGLIQPVNEMALYSYCLELCISEPSLDAREEALLLKLGEILGIESADMVVITKLMAQRRSVEIQKIF